MSPLAGMSANTFARRFGDIMLALHIPKGTYTPASLRPGGATWDYLNGLPIGNLKFRGRWAAESSLEHYIQECVAYLDFENLSKTTVELIDVCDCLFEPFVQSLESSSV